MIYLLLCIVASHDVGLLAAKQAKSPADFADSLHNYFEGSSVVELQAFAREMFSRVERRTSGVNVSLL